jgi:hypothetical protein
VIDTADMGLFAAAALMVQDSPSYRNAKINMAGDEPGAIRSSRPQQTKGIPTAYKFLTSPILLLVKDLKMMTRFLQQPRFGAQVEGVKGLLKMTDFRSGSGRAALLVTQPEHSQTF